MLMSIYCGWQLVILERFGMERVLQTIQNYRITLAYVPPPIVLAFGKDPLVDKYDLTSLKMLHSGAAPLTRELTEAVWNRLKIPVKQGFGLSEASPVVHCQRLDEWAKFMGSVGKLLPNMEAKIVDENNNEVADGEVCLEFLSKPGVAAMAKKKAIRLTGLFCRQGNSGLKGLISSWVTSTAQNEPRMLLRPMATSKPATSSAATNTETITAWIA